MVCVLHSHLIIFVLQMAKGVKPTNENVTKKAEGDIAGLENSKDWYHESNPHLNVTLSDFCTFL